jgi:hypothetical protein
VNALLDELQCLVEDAYHTALTANLSAINVPDESTADNKLSHEYDFTEVEASASVMFSLCPCYLRHLMNTQVTLSMYQKKEEQPADQLNDYPSLVTIMILVHNMLKLDYMMQVNLHLYVNMCSLALLFRIELPCPECERKYGYFHPLLSILPAGEDCWVTVP